MKNSTGAVLIACACFAFGTLMAFFAQYWIPHYIVIGPEDVFGPYIWTCISYGFGVFLLIGALILRNDERKAGHSPPPPPAPKRACPNAANH